MNKEYLIWGISRTISLIVFTVVTLKFSGFKGALLYLLLEIAIGIVAIILELKKGNTNEKV